MAKSSSDSAPTEASTGEMVSEVKEIEGTRRSARLRGMNREGKKTISEAMLSSIDVEAKRRIPVKKSKAMQKRKRAKIKIPKKPPTAFFYFLEDFRKGYLNQNPDVKSMRHVGKACGEVWNTMSYEEKIKYYDIAMEKRAEFDKAMAEYTKRMESGEVYEDEEEEDWSS